MAHPELDYTHNAIATGAWVEGRYGQHTHQVIGTATGALTATVVHEGTNDPAQTNGVTLLGTFTLSGTDADSDELVDVTHQWRWIRSRCTAISGTGAVVRSIVTGV